MTRRERPRSADPDPADVTHLVFHLVHHVAAVDVGFESVRNVQKLLN